MNRARPFLNKYTLQKQLEITDTYHSLNMKLIKPITSKFMEHTDNVIINNSKREKIKQTREIQIERENKILLDKITSTLNKKGAYSVQKVHTFRTKVNKSLNEIYRKQQEKHIQDENRRFLARLQNKKATMNVQRLNKDWEDNKEVIKRMSNHQFYLTTLRPKDNHSRFGTPTDSLPKNKIELAKIDKIYIIDGCKMKIRAQFVKGFLKITAENLTNGSLKIIEIPKQQAIIYIQQQCKGKIESLLDHLRYDQLNDTLYILSQSLAEVNVEEDYEIFNPQTKKQKERNFIDVGSKKEKRLTNQTKTKHQNSFSIISQQKISELDSNIKSNLKKQDAKAVEIVVDRQQMDDFNQQIENNKIVKIDEGAQNQHNI